ncbi:MAG: M1 family aminopeptidase [Melioribacteraceae bacterium]|nr:M1 family aminopeptidase [Melioribacteraceae bacterium]
MNFEMPQPIPAYLLALAVGDVKFSELGPRTGVYAEHSVIKDAAYEFVDTENMIRASEEMYGPYLWGRYDMIVLPPSFPYGGMENPRLTFLTPTLLAGDRSLTSVVAHEIAHSWSGNLVTNATWSDFWLNEGFTSYFEQRIMEQVYGFEYKEMLAHLDYQNLIHVLGKMGWDNPDTKLYVDMSGRDPDEKVSAIAYDEGALFLRNMEEKVGREDSMNFFLTILMSLSLRR